MMINKVFQITLLFSLFSIFPSNIKLDFHKSIWVVPLKHLMHFLAGTGCK